MVGSEIARVQETVTVPVEAGLLAEAAEAEVGVEAVVEASPVEEEVFVEEAAAEAGKNF